MSVSNKSLVFKTVDEMYSWTRKFLEDLEKKKDLKKVFEDKKEIMEKLTEVDRNISENCSDLKKIKFLCDHYKDLVKQLAEDDCPFDVPETPPEKSEIKKTANNLKQVLKL